mmetsp:Transcript_63940/g.169238  ORF Transcript_63940/g.169238 Transcript_63940/m.169238 type:complete len:107 (-) Transcript_63940:1087-1407(-)
MLGRRRPSSSHPHPGKWKRSVLQRRRTGKVNRKDLFAGRGEMESFSACLQHREDMDDANCFWRSRKRLSPVSSTGWRVNRALSPERPVPRGGDDSITQYISNTRQN